MVQLRLPSWKLPQWVSHFRPWQIPWLHDEPRQGIAIRRFCCHPKIGTIPLQAGICSMKAPEWPPCNRARCSCSLASPRSKGTKLHHWLCRCGKMELQPKKTSILKLLKLEKCQWAGSVPFVGTVIPARQAYIALVVPVRPCQHIKRLRPFISVFLTVTF